MPSNDSSISQLHHPADSKERHGLHKSRTYDIWQAMRQRVHNPKRRGHELYGGRGITIDPRWDSFTAFLEDMGECPPLHSLDRKDPNGNYCKDNCQWATGTEQQRNRRDNIKLTFKDQTKSIWDWAEETGINVGTIDSRIRKGWDAERILTTPADQRFNGGLLLTLNGETRNLSQWAKHLGIKFVTIQWRVAQGWPVEKVLSPVKERKR